MSDRGSNQYQKRRNLRRGIALGLVFISFMALLADRQQKTLLASGRIHADSVNAKIMGWMAVPWRGTQALFANTGERTNAYKNNKDLMAEVDRLRPFEARVYDLEMRINGLEKILNMGTSSDIPTQKIMARTVSEINGPFAHTSLINAGRKQGVIVNNPVMTIDGLYGHVISSGKTSSRVLLLNDLNSRIAVMSQRSLSRAIMVGDNVNMPKLEYISLEADWAAGDRVVTSGDGGVLPKGLEIGIVLMDENKNINVSLFVKDKPVDWVWVYPYRAIQKPSAEDQAPSNLILPNLISPNGENGE